MFKLLSMAGVVAVVIGCAATQPGPAADPMQGSRGSTETGAAKAADLGFHGPMDRSGTAGGPN